MEVELRYVWDSEGSGQNLDDINVATIKNDIARMIIKGCDARKLRSKIRKLNSLNSTIL